MKKIFTLLTLAFISSTSLYAASLQNCKERVSYSCNVVVTGAAACKIVQDYGVPDKVVFFDESSILSFQILREGSRYNYGVCGKSKTSIRGMITDSVVVDGRLYFADTWDSRLLVIGRDNSIVEMYTSAGYEYLGIVAVEFGQKNGLDALVIRQDRTTTVLDAIQLDRRLNDRSTRRILAESY